MYKNRMNELLKFVKEPSLVGCKLKGNILSDEINQTPEQSKYTEAAGKVKLIKELTLILEKNSREYFRATRPQKQKQIYAKINSKISQGNNLMKELKPLIQNINKQVKQQKEIGDNSSVVDCQNITTEATEALKNFRESQEKISDEIKSTIHRQANLIQGEQISDKQLEELVLHPERGQQMLKEKLLDSPSVQLQNSVSDIIDKCNDVLRLEKSMRECMQMMEELALLVNLQGQKLTTIQMAIDGAKNHVEKGDVKLQKGKQYHKKSKKKMCCIMMIVLMIVGIVVIPVVITQLK